MADFTNIEISFFLGAHRVAGRHLHETLQANDEILKSAGVVVPGMKECSAAISQMITATNKGTEPDKAREIFLQRLTDGVENPKKLIVMSKGIVGSVKTPFNRAQIYSTAAGRCERLNQIFVQDNVQYYFAVRNPAHFLRSAYGESVLLGKAVEFDNYLERVDVERLKWSTTFEKIMTTVPDGNLTVWRYEDYDDIWQDVIGAMTGITPDETWKNDLPVSNKGMSVEGAEQLAKYLAGRPELTAEKLAAVSEEYINKYPADDSVSTHPLLSNETIRRLSYSYDDDWYYVERLEGVNVIQNHDDTA